MKNKLVFLSAVSISFLTLMGCAPSKRALDFNSDDELVISKEGKYILEAETVAEFGVNDDEKASNKKYFDIGSTYNPFDSMTLMAFELKFEFSCKINMKFAYASDENISLLSDISFIYDENRNIKVSDDKGLEDKFQEFNYEEFTTPLGYHNFLLRQEYSEGPLNLKLDYILFDIAKIHVEAPEDDGEVPENDFHTVTQYRYMNEEDLEKIESYARGVEELSIPRALKIDFTYNDSVEVGRKYYVEYADNKRFSDSKTLEVEQRSFEFYNAKLGETIYWRASIDEDNLENAVTNTFEVADRGPRNLYVPGLSNVRDIGGYDSYLFDGAKINQGLYIRGAKIDTITDEGKEVLRDDLGIRVEIDMRDSNQCKGPYVDGIDYVPASIPSGTESRRFEEFADVYKKIFGYIVNADENPIYLHCTAGADRTGIVSFMLMTVCGAEYNDIARDYLFTNFSTQGSRFSNFTSEFKQWWSKLDRFEGDTKAEKAKQWLISKGITAEQVEHIREIFVEGYEAE